MSDSSVLTTPNTAALSVMRTFTSSPSRVLMVRSRPSTTSMVPRIRTVGACCAHATDPNIAMAASAAESVRDIDELIFGMISLQKCCADLSAQTPQAGGYSANVLALHRRGQAVAADADAAGLVGAVGELLHEGDHLGARLQIGLVAGDVGDNRRFRRHHDFLLAILVFDEQRVAVIARDAFGDHRIGHGRVRLEIVGPGALPSAAHV